MKPYKLKHVPTGLYYQPHKHRGSHLSKRGKIYQTSVNILSIGYYSDSSKRDTLVILCEYGSQIYNLTKDILNWSEPSRSYYGNKSGQVKCTTLVSDWIKEKI